MNGRPITLLVEGNGVHAKTIDHALSAQRLPPPTHMRTGEEAVSWASLNECDICILNFTLPGIDGMETMARLREWKADVPMIMLSGLKSEQVVVAAFRAGVRDFVPMIPGYVDELTTIVVTVAQGLTIDGRPMLRPAPGSQDATYLRPTYENRLRDIGRQLDLYGYKTINISEVGGGFLVRAMLHDGRSADALEFVDRDARYMLSYDVGARGERERSRPSDSLLPTGYEDFLRALGHRLDSNRLQAVTVTELAQFIAVGGLVPLDNSNETTFTHYSELLQSEQIKYLLHDGIRRRSSQRPSTVRPRAKR